MTLKTTTKRTLGMESLENRELMAADVSFGNHVLTIDLGCSGHAGESVVVKDTAGWVKVNAGSGTPEYNPGLHIRSRDVHQIVVKGSHGNDHINLSQVSKRQFPYLRQTMVWGGQGNDKIWGSNHRRAHDVIFGELGNDRIWGLAGDDNLYGGGGRDRIQGGGGSDLLKGGAGNDRLAGHGFSHIDSAHDRIFGEAGYDRVWHVRPEDRLWGIERRI